MAFGDIDADEEGYGIGFGGPNMSGYGYPFAKYDEEVTPLSAYVSHLLAPGLVNDPLLNKNVDLPFNITLKGGPPTINSKENIEPGSWADTAYGITQAINTGFNFINDPSQIVDPVYNFVDKNIVTPATDYLGNVIDLDTETLVDTAINSTIGQALGAPLTTIGNLTTSLLEAGGFTPEINDRNYGKGAGVFKDPGLETNLGGGGGFAPIGMGMGGGPDAAQMSPNAFGMSDPLGLDNALATNLYSFPKQFGPETIDERDFYNQFNIEIPNPTFDPKNLKRNFESNPQEYWDRIEDSFNMSEVNPVMDSNLSGVEGLMEAGGFLGGGSGVIGPDFDMGAVSRAGGEPLAQRIAETMIAQQAARAPSNNVTIPMSSGPDIVIDVTPPAPQARVAPQRRAAPRPSPVKIAAKSIVKPKAFKKLPKFAQKEIRQGKVPTSGSDNVQDMVRAFLATPEPATPRGQRPPGATR